MSDFKAILLASKAIISIPQYKEIMTEWFNNNPSDEDNYNNMIADYQFNDNIAKTHLFIKLNPDITPVKRDFVSNGVRSFFKSKTSILMSKQ